MEQTRNAENLWRVWVEKGCQLMEFRSREMFLSCVEQYTGMQYRYQ